MEEKDLNGPLAAHSQLLKPSIVGDLLQSHREKILSLWEQRTRQISPAAKRLETHILVDALPEVLDELTEQLKAGKETLKVFNREKRSALEHASQRIAVTEYTLAEVLQEYRVLRDTIFEVIRAHGNLDQESIDIILHTLDIEIKYAASRFASIKLERESSQRREAQESEAYVNALLEGSPIGMALLDREFRYIRINPVLAEINGHSVEYHIGKTVAEALPEAKDRLVPFLEKVLKTGNSILNLESVVADKQNPDRSRHFLINYYPVRATKKIVGVGASITEITAQKEAENHLRESEDRFRSLANSIPQLAWMTRPDGYIFWYNQRWYDYTGTTFKEMEGWGWKSVHHPDHLERVMKKFRDHIEKGTRWEDTFPLRSKTGEWRWFLSRAVPIRDENGRLIRWFGTNTDITDELKTKAALEESRERFDLALRAAKIGIWEMDLNSPHIKWSDRQYELFGIDPETKPLSYDIFLKTIHPEDKPKVDKEYVDSIRERRDFSLIYRIIWPDQSIHWIKANGRAYFDESGRPTRMLGTNTDVTEVYQTQEALRRSETRNKEAAEYFKTLAEAIPQVVWTSTADGKMDYFNERWREFSGLSFEESLGDGYLQAVHPEDVARWNAELAGAVRERRPISIERRLRRHDGKYIWHLTRAVPILDKAGEVFKFFGTSTNIEAQKQVQQDLLEVNNLRERFTNTLTHDLRNPLGTVKMSAQMALRFYANQAQAERFLHKIIESADRIDNMIEDLLDASRIRAGEKLHLNIENCNLKRIAEAAIEEQAMVNGDRFRLKAEGNLDGYWSCDGMRRLFENLLSNAVKYGALNTPISVILEQFENDFVRIKVHNFGNEISPEEIKGLFSMFKRTQQAKESSVRGWGIGLTLVKGIVDAHRGKVWVESGRGQGTTFCIQIPADSRTPVSSIT